MRLVVLSSGNPNDMKGVMNFVQQEVKSLSSVQGNITVSFYLVRRYYSILLSLIGVGGFLPKRNRNEQTIIDGVVYNVLWEKYGLWENIIINRLLKKIVSDNFIKKCKKQIGDFDAIITHNTACHIIAGTINRDSACKHICVWHGSDINIDPYQSDMLMRATKEALAHADINLFVSRALMNEAKKVFNSPLMDVIYTGPSDFFKHYDNPKIDKLKKEFYISGDVILGFVGNIIDVKNVLILPEIALRVSELMPGKSVKLVIVGNGNLENQLLDKLNNDKVQYTFLGKQKPERIPDIMNCLDVLILPSKNEGLPMVTLEALSCGVNVVGSNVGGISESIGLNNCFDLDSSFVAKIANRISEIIRNEEHPTPLSEKFSWDGAVKKLLSYLPVTKND